MRYSPTRIWRLLQSSRSLGGVEKVWRDALGDEWEIFHPFIKPTNEIAKSYPCPSPGGPGCPRGIVEHGPDRYVAFCGQSPPECDRLELKRADVIVHRFEVAAFAKTLAGLFQFNAKPVQHDSYCFLWRVGKYIPVPGRRFPVFLSLAPGKDDFLPALDHLLADEKEPFVLLVPTDDYLDDPREIAMNNKNCLMVPLNETVVFDCDRLSLARPPEEILADFRQAVLPEGYVEAGHTALLFSNDRRGGISEAEAADILGPLKNTFDLIVDARSNRIWHPKENAEKNKSFVVKYHAWVLHRLVEARAPLMPEQIGVLDRFDGGDEEKAYKSKVEQVQKTRNRVEYKPTRGQYQYIKTVRIEGDLTAYQWAPDAGLRYALIYPLEDE